jgi:hypothetical protein
MRSRLQISFAGRCNGCCGHDAREDRRAPGARSDAHDHEWALVRLPRHLCDDHARGASPILGFNPVSNLANPNPNPNPSPGRQHRPEGASIRQRHQAHSGRHQRQQRGHRCGGGVCPEARLLRARHLAVPHGERCYPYPPALTSYPYPLPLTLTPTVPPLPYLAPIPNSAPHPYPRP